MLTVRTFISYCAVLAALAFLGTAFLEVAEFAPQSNLQRLSVGANELFESASNEAHMSSQRTISDIAPQIQSFSITAELFVQRNLTKARLQFAAMANSIPAFFSNASSAPKAARGWVDGGPQVAAQKAGSKANELANKVPVVNNAIHSATRAIRDSLGN